ncbi:hypothetical protein AEAC466_07795 [Asticcacaulis sp. AC466]|uniref:uroporphyrinogen-III synthase n=1 Tax=Asticcacaulis sp. AC466 TaxID=1282362 RepID=UPI0003C3FC5C|nr:uroporphyrinogen-III synthase [Asticcacaulis sp. AC466]ESQ84950.1 hypothetical protein AEAC466_07795 [Asticcacaulis sp. AC466]
MKTAVWITRTASGANRTARAIEAKGYEAIVAPVLQVQPLKAIIDPHSFDAVIVTSRNGLSGFTALCARRAVPIWCVGDATAEAARAAKFQEVISAGGSVDDLVDLIDRQGDRHLRFLYAAAKTPAAALTDRLRTLGFTVTEVAVYETQPVPAPLVPALLSRIGPILLHSARGGQAVADILIRHHDKIAFRDLSFICISEAAWQGVETTLRAARTPEIEKSLAEGIAHRISPFPDEAAMLMLLDESASR